MTLLTVSASTMKERLRADLRMALRERRSAAAGVLRMLIAALDNAEAQPVASAASGYSERRFGDGVEVARRVLDAAEVRRIIEGEREARQSAAEELARLGRGDAADGLLAEAAVIDPYLTLLDGETDPSPPSPAGPAAASGRPES